MLVSSRELWRQAQNLYENTHNLLPDAFECASQVLKNEEKIMALLNILQYPDERLHTVAKPVEQVDERIQKLVADTVLSELDQ